MRVAIIGGIGSGKSEVLKIAKEKGFFCLSADEINANLLVSPSYIAKIAAAFPTVVKDGAVDKKALANIVFFDDEQLETLNAIAHPEIAKVINECAEPLVAAELPIVLESVIGEFDEILFVSTPYRTRIKRLKGRGLDESQAKARMRAQVKPSELKKIATYIVDNSGSLDDLRVNAGKIFDEILAKCTDSNAKCEKTT